MENKNFYSKTWLFCDLLLVSIWLLFCYNESFCYFAFLMPLSRIWVSFLLYRQSRFSPYAIVFSFAAYVFVLDLYKSAEASLHYPIQQFIDVFMHFMGSRNKEVIDELSWSHYDTTVFLIIKIVVLFWLVLLPIVVYIVQWRKRQLENIAIGWIKSGLIIVYLGFCLFFVIPILALDFFYLDFVCFVLIALLSVPLIFKLGDFRRFLKKEEILYFVMLIVFVCCFWSGDIFAINRIIVILLATVVFYCLYCWYYAYATSFVDLIFICLGSFLFVVAEKFTNMGRVLFLGLSLVAYFVPIFKFMFRLRRIKSGFVALFIMAVVLPILSIGYNPYVVLNGARMKKCTDCSYAPNGLMYVGNDEDGVMKEGLRDRYGVILPIEYRQIQIVDESMSLFLVEKDGRWNVYDIWKGELLFNRNYESIDVGEGGVLRMHRDSCNYDFYDYICGFFIGDK